MSSSVPGPTFALIGVAGYIARRHLEAIRDVGGTLTACHDITDSVGILDSYSPDARFFTDSVEFEDFLSREPNRPDYFVVCTPNDLHAAHAALGLRIGADVILEKPPALSSRELEALTGLAKTFKRCSCPEDQQDGCQHQWVVRYRTSGGRSSRQREQSFGTSLREAEDFALKVEHDKRAHVFVDPKAGRVLFRNAAETWLDQHLGADSSIATYRSVLRAHINPAIGGKPIGVIRREDIKTLIAGMHRKGLSASRIGCAHVVISAVLAEAVRDKRLAESPCTGIQLPGVVTAADFILPAQAQVVRHLYASTALAEGIPITEVSR